MSGRRAMGWHEDRTIDGHGAIPKSQQTPRMAPPPAIEALLRLLVARGVVAPGSAL